MKINQVEQLVGITKKNIRFYEEQGLPLEEIRLMQTGKSTVADSMKRHLVTLEREQQNVSHSIKLCEMMKGKEGLLSDLDTHELLRRMDEMEKSGASFRDIENRDVRQKKYIGAAIASAAMVTLMAGVSLLLVWAFKTDPEEAPPLPVMVIIVAVPAVVIIGVLLSLIQRIYEIKRGEEDDARKF